MNLFELIGNVTINHGEALNGLSRIESAANNLGSKLSGIGQGMQNIGGALTGAVTMPIAGLTMFGLKYNSTMEDLQTSFKVMLGSQEKAVDMTDKLVKMGAETPFESTQLAEYTKTMLSFGYTGENVLPIMSRLGDVSLGNSEKMSSLTRTMGQINSLGKLQGGDLNQLIGQGWNPLNEITKKTGETMEQVRDRMSKGKVTYKEVEDALIATTSKGGTFYNGMAEGSKTFSGQLSTLKDTFSMFLGEVTKPIFDKLLQYLPKVIEKLGSLKDLFSKLPSGAKMGILAFAGIAAAIGPVILIAGTFITAIGAILPVLGAITLPMVGVAGAIIGIGVAITAGVTAVVKYGSSFSSMKDKIFSAITTLKTTVFKIFNDIWTFLSPFWEKIKTTCLPPFNNMINELQLLIGTLADTFKGKIETIKAIWDFIFPYLKTVATPIINTIIQTVKVSFDVLGNIFKLLRQLITGDWSGAWETIKSILFQAGLQLYNIMSGIHDKISQVFHKVVASARDIIGNVGSTLYNAGRNLMDMLYNGIMSGVQKVKNAASNVASSIKSFLGFSSPTEEGAGKTSNLWMPNLINMMTKGLQDGESKIKNAVSRVSKNLVMQGESKVSLGVSGYSSSTGNVGKGQIILQINNPKFFNQADVDRMMNPVINKLRKVGLTR